MEFDRNYQTYPGIISGMFCRLCGRPTILESGLCPTCCSMKYAGRQDTELPELPYSSSVHNVNNKEDLE